MKRLIQFNLISYQHEADVAISPGRQKSRMPRYFRVLILSFFIAVLPFTKLFSNGLSVSVVSTDQANQLVTFDLSWKNSWRNTFTTAANWDAAWVFIKWRDCTASANTQFTHGLISTTLGDHNFNVLSGGTTFEPTLADGSVAGIDPSPNNTGVMLRNVANPVSGNVSARVTLKLTNLPASGTIDLRVFGVEMVFVPSSSFSLGDGNGANKSYQSFASAASGSTAGVVTSEAAQTIYESTSLMGGTIALTAQFPKGFAAYYIMKYEISQGAYTNFLNTTSALMQSLHFPNNNGNNRHTISNSSPPGVFSVTRPYRACNFLAWHDVGAYLDWAALRPLTELEYEKACKGYVATSPFDNAMGVAFSTRAVTISGTENGTETISVPGGANVSAGTTAFNGGDGGQGPLRGGIFATPSTSSRNQTGASFYGAMDLSGNVDEYYISAAAGTTTGLGGNGIVMGDGILDDANGHFNNYGWPAPLGPGNNIIHRGGSWNTTNVTGGSTAGQAYLNIADRQGGASIARLNTSGGRGGRSVSPTPTSSLTTPMTFSYTGSMQYFRVPPGVTSLTIDAYGAGGGISTSTNAGTGAEMKGACTVSPGEVLQILVGGIASTARGGGGGTFVVRSPYNTLGSVLVVAGAGGGQGTSTTVGTPSAKNGQLGTSGGAGYNGTDAGGTNGNGGSSGSTGYGAGGGFLTNGAVSGTYGGFAYVNGGAGSTASGNGGYGCGGTTGSTTYGAGGGGYSGGGCAAAGGPGGGGGSIINGTTITTSQTGTAVGIVGQVILNW